MSSENKTHYSHLLAVAGGAFLGYAFSKGQANDAKKSRAERDDPEGVEDVCDEIANLLDEWVTNGRCVSEADYTKNLAGFLFANSEWEIEVCASSPEGRPDILIGDLLALEIKVGLGKSQRDRLIGQCAGYSRLWVTWAVIINASESEVGRLEDLLDDKGLTNIAVWKF